MKNIKVIFRGTKAPSGKTTDVEYVIGKERLESLKKSGMFDMEIDSPKAKEVKKPSKKKVDKEKE